MLVLQKIWVRFRGNVTGLSLSQAWSWMRNLLCTKIGNQIWLTQCMFEFLGSAQTSSPSADGHENHKTVCIRKKKNWVVGFFNFKSVKLATSLIQNLHLASVNCKCWYWRYCQVDTTSEWQLDSCLSAEATFTLFNPNQRHREHSLSL